MKKPIVFRPQLFTPQGINNYPGTMFKCFTKGNSIPFKFTFKNKLGEILDVTGYSVWVIFSDKQATAETTPEEQVLVSVQIPLTDLENGVFEGVVTDEQTNILPAGIVFAEAKYVNAAGDSFTIDMCMLEVYPAVSFDTL